MNATSTGPCSFRDVLMSVALDEGHEPIDSCLLEMRAGERRTARIEFERSQLASGLFQRHAEPYHTPTRARAVFDVSGAGDTAIALFTLGLCAGGTPIEAAEIANHASGIAVGKLGTAIVTLAELRADFSR